jgi:hypothetical protein
MYFRLFALTFFIIPGLCLGAPGRSPAVEDFVGIELDQTSPTPVGNQALYNLEQDVGKIAIVKTEVTVPKQSSDKILSLDNTYWNISNILGFIIILSLPLISWAMVLNHLRNKASEKSAPNIQVLANYKKERELLQNQKKDNQNKKAS